MNCPECGKSLPNDAVVCTKCGTNVNNSKTLEGATKVIKNPALVRTLITMIIRVLEMVLSFLPE